MATRRTLLILTILAAALPGCMKAADRSETPAAPQQAPAAGAMSQEQQANLESLGYVAPARQGGDHRADQPEAGEPQVERKARTHPPAA